jgi:hypothetical protein
MKPRRDSHLLKRTSSCRSSGSQIGVLPITVPSDLTNVNALQNLEWSSLGLDCGPSRK